MATMMQHKRESEIQGEIVDNLRRLGAVVYVFSDRRATPKGAKGVSDVMAIFDGRLMLWVESKSQRGRLSREQSEFLALVNHLCDHVIGIKANSWDDVERVLAAQGIIESW